jgi:hypothetical protein
MIEMRPPRARGGARYLGGLGARLSHGASPRPTAASTLAAEYPDSGLPAMVAPCWSSGSHVGYRTVRRSALASKPGLSLKAFLDFWVRSGAGAGTRLVCPDLRFLERSIQLPGIHG